MTMILCVQRGRQTSIKIFCSAIFSAIGALLGACTYMQAGGTRRLRRIYRVCIEYVQHKNE